MLWWAPVVTLEHHLVPQSPQFRGNDCEMNFSEHGTQPPERPRRHGAAGAKAVTIVMMQMKERHCCSSDFQMNRKMRRRT
jgi:hypothetical protein